MKIYKGYVLVSELTHKAKKSATWLYSLKSVEIEHIKGTPVVPIASLPEKYQSVAKECQDLESYYPFAAFSVEIGREESFMCIFAHQRKKANKPELDTIKIRRHRLLKLSSEFIELANKNLTPYKLGQTYDPTDWKVIIEMQNMKIGFY